jgi:hypothetical protein
MNPKDWSGALKTFAVLCGIGLLVAVTTSIKVGDRGNLFCSVTELCEEFPDGYTECKTVYDLDDPRIMWEKCVSFESRADYDVVMVTDELLPESVSVVGGSKFLTMAGFCNNDAPFEYQYFIDGAPVDEATFALEYESGEMEIRKYGFTEICVGK